jgi:hypothetical protein
MENRIVDIGVRCYRLTQDPQYRLGERNVQGGQMASASPQAIDPDEPCKYHENGVPTPLKSHASSCK